MYCKNLYNYVLLTRLFQVLTIPCRILQILNLFAVDNTTDLSVICESAGDVIFVLDSSGSILDADGGYEGC